MSQSRINLANMAVPLSTTSISGSQTAFLQRRRNSTSVSNFIQKTYNILQEKKYESIVSWTDQKPQFHCLPGNLRAGSSRVSSFQIHNVKAFEEIVLPAYFKHSNLSSFVRQLNMYDFHKVRGGKNEFEFEHDKFRKDCPELLMQIKRKQTEDNSYQPISSLALSNEEIGISKVQIDNINEANQDSQKGKPEESQDTFKFTEGNRENNAPAKEPEHMKQIEQPTMQLTLHPTMHPSLYQPIYQPIYQSINPSMYQPIYQPLYQPIYHAHMNPINQTMHSVMNPNMNSSMNPNLNSSINPNIGPSMNPNLNSSMNTNMNISMKQTMNSSMGSMLSPSMNSSMNPPLNSPMTTPMNASMNTPMNPMLSSSLNMLNASPAGQMNTSIPQAIYPSHRQQPEQPQRETQSENAQTRMRRRLVQLQEINNSLKKIKQSKQSILKSLSHSNQMIVSDKFSKVIISVIASKIKEQTHGFPQLAYLNKPQSSQKMSMNELIKHVLSSQASLSFAEYADSTDDLFSQITLTGANAKP